MMDHAQEGLAKALASDEALDQWARSNSELVTEVTEQLARHAIPLTSDEYAMQLGRRLRLIMSIGPERARRALGC